MFGLILFPNEAPMRLPSNPIPNPPATAPAVCNATCGKEVSVPIKLRPAGTAYQ
jgi:hypothetical protein